MKNKRFRIPIIGLICCMLLGTIAFAVNGRKITATYGGITIYLNGQKQADGGQSLRAAQGARRIGKFFEETRKKAVHQKTPPRIIDPASRAGMIRRDDRNKETVLGRRDTAKALFLRPVFFPHTST